MKLPNYLNVEMKRKAILIDGIPIHYQFKKGKGDLVLVFINSLGTDFRIWDEVIELLGDQVSTLRFDKRGHGLSGLSQDKKEGNISIYADDILTLLESLSIGKFVLVGLSIGGLISMDLISRFPEKVEGMILMDTAAKIGTYENWTNRIELIKGHGIPAAAPSILQNWFSADFQKDYFEEFALYGSMLCRTDKLGYIKACEAIRNADYTSETVRIKIPVSCVVGEEDKSTPVTIVKNLSEQIPGSKLNIVPKSGHLPCVDNPTITTGIIQQFLQSL